MMRRLLPALLLCSTAMAQEPLPYGPIALPSSPVNVVISDRTVALVIDAISRTPDAATRVRLTHDLGSLPAPTAHAALLKLLTDTEPLVRAEAVRGLAGAAETNALINDTSADVRRAVVATTGDDSTLIKGYADADVTVRSAALGLSISQKSDAALAAALATLSAPEQAAACRTLAGRKFAGDGAIASLLDSDSLLVRTSAIRALAAIGTVTPQQLKPQLAHAHPAVRQAAVEALAALRPADQLALATAALDDPDAGVRAAAVSALAPSAGASAVSKILTGLATADEDFRSAAHTALPAIASRDPAASAVLDARSAELLTSPDALLRADGSLFLGAIKSKTALPAHIALLKDADWNVVLQAARSLGQIADASAAPALATAAARAAGIDDPAYAQWSQTATADQFAVRGSAGEQAILSCVAMHFAPVNASVGELAISKTAPAAIRIAAVYALGRLAPVSDAEAPLRTLLSRVKDPQEIQDVVTEAVKAVGNAHVVSLESTVESLAATGDWPLRGDATVVLDYLRGTHTPVTPPPKDVTPDTSVRDLNRDLTPAAR